MARRVFLTVLGSLLSVGFAFGQTVTAPQGVESYYGHAVRPNSAIVKLKVSPLLKKLEKDLAAVLHQIKADLNKLSNKFKVALDVDNVECLSDGTYFLVHSKSKVVRFLVSELAKSPFVEQVTPNYVWHIPAGETPYGIRERRSEQQLFQAHIDSFPNDEDFASQWGLRNTGQTIGGTVGRTGVDTSAYSAWDLTTGDTSVAVAIFDTGIDYNHEDLKANLWSAPIDFDVTIGSDVLHCPQGSHGFNALRKTFDPMDDHGHGTHCAGTIGAMGNNGLGIAGLNWHSALVACKCADSNGRIDDAAVIRCFQFVAEISKPRDGYPHGLANVRIISNSWDGDGANSPVRAYFQQAYSQNILCVAAAGNNGNSAADYPACFPNVVGVAATTNVDSLAAFSNFGQPTTLLAAPGKDIWSTWPGNRYAFDSGTSMAAPFVSGALAMLCAMNPSLNAPDLATKLSNSVDLVSALRGKVRTGGRLNIQKLLSSVAPQRNQ